MARSYSRGAPAAGGPDSAWAPGFAYPLPPCQAELTCQVPSFDWTKP
jgi:hypothetical protein